VREFFGGRYPFKEKQTRDLDGHIQVGCFDWQQLPKSRFGAALIINKYLTIHSYLCKLYK